MVEFFYEFDSLTWLRLGVPSQAETVINNVFTLDNISIFTKWLPLLLKMVLKLVNSFNKQANEFHFITIY